MHQPLLIGDDVRKIAFFVEGATEIYLMERIFEELADLKKITISALRMQGGVNVPKSIISIQLRLVSSGQEFYVLLVDCCGDIQVATRIKEEYASLHASGYELIVGIRDVRPTFTAADIPRLQAGLQMVAQGSPVPVEFVLGVLECEAWFIAEHGHFSRLDSRLTPQTVIGILGYDPSQHDVSLVNEPAADLDKVYSYVGRRYKKPYQATLNALDMAEFSTTTAARFPDLQRLFKTTFGFLNGS